jgi:hypothetical protein
MSMDRDPTEREARVTASSSYVLGRLWRAIETATTHDDLAVRQRAEQKALAWESVLSGMASGVLAVGSRTPVANTPAWVTLEVVHGGLATGRYVAEGPLADDERVLINQIPSGASGATDRMRLNTWFLSDEGLTVLIDAVRTGNYVVDVPEHGALVVVAWLIGKGHDALALDLVSELYPLLDRLRFYPVLKERPPTSGAVVHLRTVEDVVSQLQAVAVPEQVAAMNETLQVWHPLYDRLVALWLETVEDDWPCAQWPFDWANQRRMWLDDYERAAREHTRCGEHKNPRSNFAVLRDALDRCELDSSALSGRDVGRIRLSLHRTVARWGEPRSSERDRIRDAQRAWVSRPTHKQLASIVCERLAPAAPDSGIADLEPVLEPITLDAGGEGATSIPHSLTRKVERALEAPIEELVERGIIPSSEVLALVLPQISSHVASGAFEDASLRELYARIYAAFRRRRSLLLLNLEHQVQIEELPWVRSLDPFRALTANTRHRALDTLKHTTLLAFASFPQTILPNPLVREMTALAKQAEVDIPFVEEIAADIFMGTFTIKWREAAALTARVMADTLYARYYDLPAASTWEAPEEGDGVLARVRARWGKRTAEDFTQICAQRSREAASGDGSQVARNGAVIEQSQILTSHNLAPLVDQLSLADGLRSGGSELAVEILDWIVRQQNTRFDSWHAQLQMLKNTAYAWRQAVFFLSFVEASSQRDAVESLRSSMESRADEWQSRFHPVVTGLELVVNGAFFDASGRLGDGRRFLGWAVGPHWLLPARESRRR